ncbi:MAG: MATE family efflux transporter [Desulfurococcaceae archaeon]
MAHSIGVIEEYRERVVNGPIGRTLLWLGLPLMIVQIVHVSYNVADAYWLSRYSKVAYATPRQIWPFFMFINALVQGLGAANMAFISQAIGARDYDYAKKIVSFFVTTTLVLNTITVTVFVLLGPYVYRHVMVTPPEIYNYVVTYSSIISLDLFLSGLYLCYSTIFQAMGDTRTPSRAGIVSSLINIVLDPLFIFGVRYGDDVLVPEMGVAGAAWATVLSRFTGFLIVLRALFKRYPFLKTRPTLNIEREWLIRSVKIGAPVALMMMSNSMAFMLQNRLINSFGAYVTAAAAIGFVLMDLADAALWGFTSSVATMVGQALGAHLEERARKVVKTAMLYIGTCTFTGSAVILVFRSLFIGFFTDVPEIAREADLFVQYFAPTLAFFAVFFIGMSIGRGSGHTPYPTIIGVIRLWGLRIGLGYLLAFVLEIGTLGLWTSMAFSNFVGGLAIVPWALRGNWTKPVIRRRAFT